jgi:transposase-like protein
VNCPHESGDEKGVMWYNVAKKGYHMKEAKKLSMEEKKEVCRERFEEGKSTNEVAKEYGVCQRTVVRISNKYREKGMAGFEKGQKKERVKKEEGVEEKIERLEEENEMLRDINKLLTSFAKKN